MWFIRCVAALLKMWHFQVSKVLQKCERDLITLPYLPFHPTGFAGLVENLPQNGEWHRDLSEISPHAVQCSYSLVSTCVFSEGKRYFLTALTCKYALKEYFYPTWMGVRSKGSIPLCWIMTWLQYCLIPVAEPGGYPEPAERFYVDWGVSRVRGRRREGCCGGFPAPAALGGTRLSVFYKVINPLFILF